MLGLTAARGPRPAQHPTPHYGEPAGENAGTELDREIPALLTNAARQARLNGCRLEFAVPPQLAMRADRASFREAMSLFLAHAIRQA
ncbi:MAG TPA: hypothetical protein VFN42_00405, partial [Acetobacteraceae bacterium]|nr:hypothetical protein [Acetobacteraceae bacterium]